MDPNKIFLVSVLSYPTGYYPFQCERPSGHGKESSGLVEIRQVHWRAINYGLLPCIIIPLQ